MATFLDTLSNREDKEYYLKQAFTHKIDIDASLLILAANQQRNQTFSVDNHQEIISTNSKHLDEVYRIDINLMNMYICVFLLFNFIYLSM